MRARFMVGVGLACAAVIAGCNRGGAKPLEGDDPPAAAVKVAPSGLVEIPDGGKELSPPVKPDQLPSGSWYCEMGGMVHWAQLKEGDRRCPLCGMELKHKE